MGREVFGARPGDVIGFDLQGTAGPVDRGEAVLDEAQDRAFRAQGRRLTVAPGTYAGTVTLTRAGAEIDRRQVALTLP